MTTKAMLPGLLSRAVQQFNSNELIAAEQTLFEILEIDEDHFDALHILGAIRARQNDFSAARQFLARAVHLNPDHAYAQANYAKVLSDSGAPGESIAHHERSLQLLPKRFEAWHEYAKSLLKLQRQADAVRALDTAVLLEPQRPVLWQIRGHALHDLGRLHDALVSFERAIAVKPDYLDAWFGKGVTLTALNRLPEALSCFDRAIDIEANHQEIWLNRGVVLNGMKQFPEALASLDQADRIGPASPLVWANRGIALNGLKQLDEALAAHEFALGLKPDFHEAWSYRGVALHDIGRLQEALDSYEKALSLHPDYVEALANQGVTLQELKRYDEALACYGKALALRPDDFRATWNQAVTLLTLGDLRNGWAKYRRRWDTEDLGKRRHVHVAPVDSLEQVSGKTVICWSEQGLGDTLQFCRYASLLCDRGARVILDVQEPLRALMKASFPNCEVLVHDALTRAADYQIPLMDLPHLFDTTLASIPAAIPYLTPSATKLEQWTRRLPSHKGVPKIGIACSGNKKQLNDRARAIPLEKFEPLSRIGELFLIQKDIRPTDRGFLSNCRGIRYVGDDLADFDDTAALVSQMDLIVCVDTSLGHLAGAMGKTTYVLLPWAADWRWLIDRSDTPWYPTTVLFRQAALGDWKSAIEAVHQQSEIFFRSPWGY